jgi:hypothetical protein
LRKTGVGRRNIDEMRYDGERFVSEAQEQDLLQILKSGMWEKRRRGFDSAKSS